MIFSHNNLFRSESIKNVYNYLNTLLKLRKVKILLYFNKTCKRMKLVPNYIKIGIKDKSLAAQTTKYKAERIWLNKNIQELYTKVNRLTIKLYNQQSKIANQFHYLEYCCIKEFVDKKVEKRLRQRRRSIKNKIIKLKQTQRKPQKQEVPLIKHKFNERTVNLTDIVFNAQEKSLLDKGLKHNLTPKSDLRQQNRALFSLESSLRCSSLKRDTNLQDNLRNQIMDQISKTNTTQRKRLDHEEKIAARISKKIKELGAVITKADKGNTTVIMDEKIYNEKVLDYIKDNNIITLNTDPTNIFSKEINKKINECKSLLDQREMRYLKMIKPYAPRIRGLPKIHKPEMPIRPVINFTSAPTYKIAKYVNQYLMDKIKLTNNVSLKNNLELVNRIESISIPHNAKLASFDITNMYSNIPIDETIEITHALLVSQGETKYAEEIKTLLKTITKQNYFEHQNLFYTQQEGLPMGSPLSGTLANIFLNHIENTKILSNCNPYKNLLVYWHRYVDDILVMFKGTERQLTRFHKYINTIHNNIKFTLETEENKSINFLDLTIKNENNKHRFKVFRKPTQTDHTINFSSHHPQQHKLAAYFHMINRLNNIPMCNEDYNEELNTIKQIAESNGFNPATMDLLNKRFKNKKLNEQYTSLVAHKDSDSAYITFEYNHIANIIRKVLTKQGLHTAFKTTNKLGQKLTKHNSNTDDTGVYRLSCDDCDGFYIGQTGKSFTTRFNQHVKEIGKPKIDSNYAQHMTDRNHKYTDITENLKVLHKCKKSSMMTTLEDYEIYKNRNNSNIINIQVATKSNRIFELIIANEEILKRGRSQNLPT